MNKHYVSIYGNAMSIQDHKPCTYAKDLTLRYKVLSPFDGDSLKLTFDNYCGTEPVSINLVTVLYRDNFYPVTFNNGAKNFTMAAGENAVSDELPVNIRRGEAILVSFYLKDYTLMRSSVVAEGPLSGGIYAVGDQTCVKDIPINIKRKTNIYYFLSNISLLTDMENRCIVCYGDSITAQDWPDYLQLRCIEEGYTHTSIIRRATSGSRILREYHDITYESYGLMGKHRFEHEVPTDGCDTVIIQQGINDIIHPVGEDINPFRPMSDLPTASELYEGMEYYIDKARSYGYKVYLGSLLPIEGWRTYAAFREELKNEFNRLLQASNLSDGFIDFHRALEDPMNPKAFLKEYNSGDCLHPSASGYKKMAEAVPSHLLK